MLSFDVVVARIWECLVTWRTPSEEVDGELDSIGSTVIEGPVITCGIIGEDAGNGACQISDASSHVTCIRDNFVVGIASVKISDILDDSDTVRFRSSWCQYVVGSPETRVKSGCYLIVTFVVIWQLGMSCHDHTDNYIRSNCISHHNVSVKHWFSDSKTNPNEYHDQSSHDTTYHPVPWAWRATSMVWVFVCLFFEFPEIFQ